MPAITIKGRNVPIEVWAPIEEVDTQVINQLKNVAALQSYCNGGASPVGENAACGPGRARTEATMRKVVRCTCGVEIRAEDERELVARVQAHAREAHELSLSAEQVLAMAEIDEERGS